MTLDQSIVWTALPNGWAVPGSKLAVSVFVAPRLESSAHPPLLTPFDFANWPDTLADQRGAALSFRVTFEGHPPVNATVTSTAPDATRWSYIFRPAHTRVDPWKFKDLSGAPLQSFSVTGVESFVQKFYAEVGSTHPFSFPPASLLSKYLPADENNRRGGPGWDHITEAVGFHRLPHSLPADTVHDPRSRIPVPTFDFHATLSALHSYPALMRQLGLVFDLEVPVPSGLSATPKVKVTPEWHPSPSVHGTIDVSPWTACRLTGSSFRAAPRGPDYANGMLNLGDKARFAVVELDTDGAADRLSALATAMSQTHPASTNTSEGTPALRSAGLTVIWSGWAEQPSKGAGRDLTDLLTSQKANNAVIESYIAAHGTGPLPTLHAEDLVRGHRFDVLTTSEATPAWRSLCFRAGTYRLGKPEHLITIDDEGAVSSSLSQPSGLVKYNPHTGAFGASVPAPPDLYAHERIARWKGWSLVAERPGKSGVGPGTELRDNGNNPVPPTEPGAVGSPPLLSVTFKAPTSGSQLLPKLRFGDFYRFRARAADLAGNGVEVASSDASTATAPTPHLRFEPVESPQLAATKLPAPGEGTQLMVILNDQVNPVPPNGRWVFPPKVSELMAEEHGMLDGFVEGSAPNPNKPPSGTAATFAFLATRDPARLNDLPGVEFYGANFNSTGNPNVGTPYFPGATKLAVPWVPDPLSSGVTMVGVPGTTGPVVRRWEGGPWPDPEPLLLVLQAGTGAGQAYTPGTPADSPIETITLPPGETAEVAMSSALVAGAVGPRGKLLGLFVLGPWQWLADSGIKAKLLDELKVYAADGLLWQLSPARILTLVHAVRLPLVAPAFGKPETLRKLGSTKAELVDLTFLVDIKSTSSLDFLARWVDPVDDIAKPGPTLGGHSANAFKLTVDAGFKLNGSNPGATQDFGDTRHHLVDYHAVGTSRFNGYFRQTTTVTFSGTTPVELSSLGLDAASVRLSIPSAHADKLAKKFPRGDFRVDAAAGTVALTTSGVAAAGGKAVDVSWIPTDTLAGPVSAVPVLSTARPIAPTVSRVVPAWALSAPRGSLETFGIVQQRQGNFLRIYLDRPWFSSGAGELLGVVTRLDSKLPSAAQQAYTTVVGADPIYDALFSDWGSFTGVDGFLNLTLVPSVPGRPDYTNPPELSILEDTSGAKYRIWPFGVKFDPHTRLWYADVGLAFNTASTGAYPPMFVRLALARFQPWSLAGVEVSPVTLASIAQPVPDRSVLVTSGSTPTAVQVQVSGWGYAGWRPALFKTPGDTYSGISPTQDAPETYGGPTMIVEVQVQDTSSGLSGDFAWTTASGTRPVMLPAPGDNGAFVSWSGEVPIPKGALSSARPYRLRISEIDFYTEPTAPAVVDTTYRRPFVVHIPLS